MRILQGWWSRWEPPPPPVRSGGDLTTLIQTALANALWGGGLVGDADPATGGGVAIAGAAHARALIAAEIDAPEHVARSLRRILPAAGHAYARCGEFAARVAGDDLELAVVEITDGHGTQTAPVWTVREHSPSGKYTDMKIAGSELLHVIWHPDRTGCRGEPPWYGTLGRAAANVEEQIIAESRMGTGHTMSMKSPAELDDEAVQETYEGLFEQYGGRGGFLPHVSQGGSYANPQGGSQSFLMRFGPEYPAAAPQLTQTLCAQVVASCGVPPLLLSMNVGGSALRDAWRSFLASSAAAVADQLAAEATRLFDTPVQISVTPRRLATPTDLVTRSRAVKSLVDAGIDITEAKEIAGL